MSKTMAEVLAEHQLCAAWEDDESRAILCMCGLELPAAKDDGGIDLAFLAAHQAAALSAAGFGLVADAKAEGADAAIAYLREGMESWAEPRVLGFLKGAQSVSADIAGNS